LVTFLASLTATLALATTALALASLAGDFLPSLALAIAFLAFLRSVLASFFAFLTILAIFLELALALTTAF